MHPKIQEKEEDNLRDCGEDADGTRYEEVAGEISPVGFLGNGCDICVWLQPCWLPFTEQMRSLHSIHFGARRTHEVLSKFLLLPPAQKNDYLWYNYSLLLFSTGILHIRCLELKSTQTLQ